MTSFPGEPCLPLSFLPPQSLGIVAHVFRGLTTNSVKTLNSSITLYTPATKVPTVKTTISNLLSYRGFRCSFCAMWASLCVRSFIQPPNCQTPLTPYSLDLNKCDIK